MIRLYVRADSIEADFFFYLFNKRESFLGWVVGYLVLQADTGTIVYGGDIDVTLTEFVDESTIIKATHANPASAADFMIEQCY